MDLAYIVALVLVLFGIPLSFVPILPALLYMFGVALVYGIFDGFTRLTVAETLILLGVALASVVVDHVSGLIGAKYGGAHIRSIFVGLVGALIGAFFVPPLGSFAGLFIGVFVSELYAKKSDKEAFLAATGALAGKIAGVAVNVVLALAFSVCFFFFALR